MVCLNDKAALSGGLIRHLWDTGGMSAIGRSL
jgi:hypothetical protein